MAKILSVTVLCMVVSILEMCHAAPERVRRAGNYYGSIPECYGGLERLPRGGNDDWFAQDVKVTFDSLVQHETWVDKARQFGYKFQLYLTDSEWYLFHVRRDFVESFIQLAKDFGLPVEKRTKYSPFNGEYYLPAVPCGRSTTIPKCIA